MPELDSTASDGNTIARWAATVKAEHEQADRVRTDQPDSDSWQKLAHRFAPAKRAQALQDETFIALKKFVRSDDTVLDVGAGAVSNGILRSPYNRNAIRY